jgi:hypothetical protein
MFLEKRVTIKQELSIDKNIEAVWEVMGNHFAKVHLWSSNFYDSKLGGDASFEGITFFNRITITERGETIQTLDVFNPNTHSMSYHITKGMPGIGFQAPDLEIVRNEFKNTSLIYLGEGSHFLHEDFPHEIGEGIANWYNKIS